MIDNNKLKILDELLQTLSISDSVKWSDIMNETLDRCELLKDIDQFTFQVALLKLVKDGYIIETNKDIDSPGKTHYHISFDGLFFIKNDGYVHALKEVQIKENAYELLKSEQNVHASSLLMLNRWMVVLTWIIAIGTLIAAVYYLLEILAFLGVYQTKKI